MRTLVLEGPGELRLRDGRPRSPQRGEIVADVLAVGICGSEVEAYRGLSTKRVPPVVLGHEAVVEWDGQRYVLNPLLACGACRPCASGRPNLCPERHLFSIELQGAFADRLTVRPSSLVVVPDELDSVTASLAEPLATALHAVSGRSGAWFERVAILGCGSLGLLAVQAAIALGAATVVAVDLVQARREHAAALGAHSVEALPEGAEFDLVVDMVGLQATRSAAVEHCAPGGTVRLVGLMSGASELPIDRVISRGLTIEGVYAYAPEQLFAAVELLAARRVDPSAFVTVRPLTEGPATFAQLVSDPESLVKAVLIP